MDLLKRELEKKRKAATADFGGKSFVRRSELEQKQLQKRRDEHRQLLAKAGTSAPSANSAAAATGSEERRIDELDLPRHEVVRRLRVLREPVTLFGENDDARLARFKLVLKSGVIDDIDMTEGQTNDFLRDMIEMRKRQKAGRDTYAKGKSKRVDDGGAAGGSADDGDAKGSGDDANADKDSKRMRTKFEELCNEDKILVFFKKLLNEWNQELDEMTELEKRTAKGKSMVATFKQCARYLSPLFEFCRKKVLILMQFPSVGCLNCAINTDAHLNIDYVYTVDNYFHYSLSSSFLVHASLILMHVWLDPFLGSS
jgi:pre-mRNA-splicing factor 18